MGEEVNGQKVGVVINEHHPVKMAMMQTNSKQTMYVGKHVEQQMQCLSELAVNPNFAKITDIRGSDMI